MYLTLLKRSIVLVLLTFICSTVFAQKNYTIEQIPNPKKAGQNNFVSNPDGILTNVSQLDSALSELEKQTKVEFAIVVVKNFNQDEEDFDFALNLFNYWGIGKQTADNGLLLFISTDRRKYRFITGDGVEGLLPDVILKQTGENLLVPAFKQQDYERGTEDVVRQIYQLLTNPRNRAEIQSLIAVEKEKTLDWTFVIVSSLSMIFITYLLFKFFNNQTKKHQGVNQPNNSVPIQFFANGCIGLFFGVIATIIIVMVAGSTGVLQRLSLTDTPVIVYLLCGVVILIRYNIFSATIKKLHFDDKNSFEAVSTFHKKNWWLLLFSPLIIIPIINQIKKRKALQERFKPLLDSSNREMLRVDRDVNIDGKPFLTEGQRVEETNKIFDYDIWQSVEKKEYLINPWPAENYGDFTVCPKCKARTLSKAKTDVTLEPTYSSSGQGRVTKKCANCKFEEFIEIATLAMLVRASSSNSSSSGSSSSSRSSSSSSRSGSFGGGRSSGGGAGGSW